MFKDSAIGKYCHQILCVLECGTPIADLLLRLWVANVFWKSGLTKIANIDSTMYLFEYEYVVPIIPFELAAYMAIAVELTLPVLLVFGLAGRVAAGILFLFNIVAVISYPTLNPAGIVQHQVWGIMLLVLLLRGPGKISIDHFIRKRFMNTTGKLC